jgi:hypothetical protein
LTARHHAGVVAALQIRGLAESFVGGGKID